MASRKSASANSVCPCLNRNSPRSLSFRGGRRVLGVCLKRLFDRFERVGDGAVTFLCLRQIRVTMSRRSRAIRFRACQPSPGESARYPRSCVLVVLAPDREHIGNTLPLGKLMFLAKVERSRCQSLGLLVLSQKNQSNAANILRTRRRTGCSRSRLPSSAPFARGQRRRALAAMRSNLRMQKATTVADSGGTFEAGVVEKLEPGSEMLLGAREVATPIARHSWR